MQANTHVQDMEAMEGDMTWNWNSGHQMNPCFLAQHLQSQQPTKIPRGGPPQSFLLDRLQSHGERPTAYGAEMQQHLEGSKQDSRAYMPADPNERRQSEERYAVLHHRSRDVPHSIPGDELQVCFLAVGHSNALIL